MLGVTLLLIFLSIICKFLVSYIKSIRTGDPNENELTYWMFSYDFKSKNKEWIPEDKNLLRRKRSRNALVFILYINVFLISPYASQLLFLNAFIACGARNTFTP